MKRVRHYLLALALLALPSALCGQSPLLLQLVADHERIVFVTSEAFDGALQPDPLGGTGIPFPQYGMDGIIRGDEICNDLAAAAGLPGGYYAWLGGVTYSSGNDESQASPRRRFSMHGGPFVRVDGVVVADDWRDLTDGDLDSPISVDELGGQQIVEVWTGASPSGTRRGLLQAVNCGSWRGNLAVNDGLVGKSDKTGSTWTDSGGRRDCDQLKHLYCFQQ